MEDSSATRGKAWHCSCRVSVVPTSVCSGEWSLFCVQAVSFHHGFPPRHVEPGLVRVYHPDRTPELHGGEGPHSGQHRDVRLHGEGCRASFACWGGLPPMSLLPRGPWRDPGPWEPNSPWEGWAAPQPLHSVRVSALLIGCHFPII